MKESSRNMGFCRLPFELLTDESLTMSDAVVYAVLLDACTDALSCTMALSTIVELTRLSNRAVHYCLDRLEQCGYIERNRTGRETVYRLADIIGLKRQQKQKPIIRQSRHAPDVPAEPEQQQMLKLRYGSYQNVALSIDEFDSLVTDFGETKALAYIKKCDEYCQQTGKSYADYNITLRKWIAEDGEKARAKQQSMSGKDYAKMKEYLSVTVGSDEYLKKQEERKERVQKYMELVN